MEQSIQSFLHTILDLRFSLPFYRTLAKEGPVSGSRPTTSGDDSFPKRQRRTRPSGKAYKVPLDVCEVYSSPDPEEETSGDEVLMRPPRRIM